MSASIINPFREMIDKIASIRSTEVLLPIAKKRCIVSSILTGDDLGLRTSLTSPVVYDRELIKILHQHTIFIEEEQNIKPAYDVFIKTLSAFDKLSLIWGLYSSSYEILSSDRKIRCENKSCQYEFSEKIAMDELIHEDTYTFWEEDLPFYELIYPIIIDYDAFKIEFSSKLPSIKDSNALLGQISVSEIQNNLEKIGEIYTKGQYMALLIKEIKITSKHISTESAGTNSLQDILISCEKFPPFVYEEFFEKYSKVFDKYIPKFYKNVQCPNCSTSFRYNIDLETEFFRRSLSGREKI